MMHCVIQERQHGREIYNWWAQAMRVIPKDTSKWELRIWSRGTGSSGQTGTEKGLKWVHKYTEPVDDDKLLLNSIKFNFRFWRLWDGIQGQAWNHDFARNIDKTLGSHRLTGSKIFKGAELDFPLDSLHDPELNTKKDEYLSVTCWGPSTMTPIRSSHTLNNEVLLHLYFIDGETVLKGCYLPHITGRKC